MTSFLQHERTTRQPPAALRELVARWRVELSQPARALLRDDDTPAAFFSRLVAAQHLRDARLFLAHALPVRRALWWSCLCAHDVCDDRQPGLREAIDTVARYVQSPSDTHRRAAEEIHRRSSSHSLAGVISAAAFYSAGSVGPSDLATPIFAPAFVAPRLVNASVYLAATIKDVVNYLQAMRDYLLVGEQIAQGQILWPDGDPPAPSMRVDLGGPWHAFAGHHHRAAVRPPCEAHP